MLSPEERLARLFPSLVVNFWHFNRIKPSNLISTLAVIILFGRITGQPVGEVVTADEVGYEVKKGCFIFRMSNNSQVGTIGVGSRSQSSAAALASDDPPLELLTR